MIILLPILVPSYLDSEANVFTSSMPPRTRLSLWPLHHSAISKQSFLLRVEDALKLPFQEIGELDVFVTNVKDVGGSTFVFGNRNVEFVGGGLFVVSDHHYMKIFGVDLLF